MRLDYKKLSPEATKALWALDKALVGGALPAILIDLVKIRVSQLNGCIFCVDMHNKEARIHGEREIRQHHIAAWRESNLFTDKEKAAFQYAELLTHIGDEGIDDADFSQLTAEFSDKEISDLTFVIGSINFWNRLGVAFRPEPGSLDKLLGLDKAQMN